MVVRIRFARGSAVRKRTGEEGLATLAMAAAGLLTPGAVMALVLGLWRISADLNLASSFYITAGPLSDWRLWCAAAALLQVCSHYLHRYGKSKDSSAS